MVCISLLRKSILVCSLTRGRVHKEAWHIFLQTPSIFSLVALIGHPFAIVNLSHECNDILSPRSPSSKCTEYVGCLESPKIDITSHILSN